MTTPAISVLMPVYNAGKYVREAVDSILRQSVLDFEFIIIDDGSTDRSLPILREYELTDSRVRIISRPNTGIIGALNDGVSIAQGEFIARMDADDRCEPNRFELQLKRLHDDSALVAIGSCAVAIDPDGRRLGYAPVPLTHEEIEERHLIGDSCIFHPAVMMRAEAFRRVGGYRPGTFPCEDYDLWLRLGEVGRLENLREPLFIWRRTETGIVGSNAERFREAIARTLGDAWQRRGLPGVPPPQSMRMMTKSKLWQQWAWLALKEGDIKLARQYALKSFRKAPFDTLSWRLIYAVTRGW